MKVRVKTWGVPPDFVGFYGNKRRHPGDEFDLVPKTDKDGKEISCERQFSERWMEKVTEKAELPKRNSPIKKKDDPI